MMEFLPSHDINVSPWKEQYPSEAEAKFKIAHDGNRICVLFECTTDEIRNMNTSDQSPVSDDSCVEVFLEPCAGDEYRNLEVNYCGAINASHRRSRKESTRMTPDELSRVWTFRRNAPTNTDNGKYRWLQYICAPFDLIGIEYYEGKQIRGNVYACAAKASKPYFLCWNPIDTQSPDYHRPEYFGTMELQ